MSEPIPRRGRSVLRHLSVFTLALSAPILIFVGVLLWQLSQSQRQQLEGDAADSAKSIAYAVDREVAGLFAALDVLSLSGFLQSGDLEGFYKQASELALRQNIVPVLSEVNGQQLVNLRTPWGAPLPKSNLDLSEVIATRRPVVTGLFTGAVSQAPQFAVMTPVLRNGDIAYILSFSLGVDRLQAILAEAEVPPEWIVSIVDRAGTIMARNQRPADFVGRSATSDLQAATRGRQGTWNGFSADGRAVFGAYSRSRLSGFRVAVGVTAADLNKPLWNSLSLFAALGLTLLAVSTVLAVLFGQRITKPIQAVAAHAAALGRGESPKPLQTGLEEVNRVGAELDAAAFGLLQRAEDLLEANEELQRFAYIVSHDLRAPLVNIMGFTTELEALRNEAFPPPGDPATDAPAGQRNEVLAQDFDEAINFIKASISKMDRLINAILKLSREGRRDFVAERIDMRGLLQGIADSLAHQVTEAGASISVGALPPVTSDRLAIEQVFTNLVDNALKYSRADAAGYIEVLGRETRNSVSYEVRDNGRGIDPRDRERVFELFRRSGPQDRPGEGIGLAHVRATVRRMGGTMTLASEPGKGSTFTVTLPKQLPSDVLRKAA